MISIEASVLSADFAALGEQAQQAERAGVDAIQIDVMDGQFVPNITFGPGIVRALRSQVELPLDVHLMIADPGSQIEAFAQAGADRLIVHQEATPHLHRLLQSIGELGVEVGVSINPGTPLDVLEEVLHMVDLIQIMTVNPGWGGQEFIQSCHKKITHLKSWLRGQNLEIPIQVDGGIKLDNMEILIKDGADILVVGSGIYKESKPSEVIKQMKSIANRYEES